MDLLKGMIIFVEVEKYQGFAPAARALNLSTSVVSRYVIELEDWMGVQLFQRTTRKVSLTDAGKAYLESCQKVVEAVNDIQQALPLTDPQGKLRVTVPACIAKRYLHNLVPSYLNQNPKVELDLVVVNHGVDLLAEGIDLAISIGEQKDSTLICRKLMDFQLVLVASPTYLQKHGTPKTIPDLLEHNCLIDTFAGYSNRWPAEGIESEKLVTVHGNLRVNSSEMVRDLACQGLGIALLPRFVIDNDIDNGQLVVLLENFVHPAVSLYALYPSQRYLSASVRSFIDYLITCIKQ